MTLVLIVFTITAFAAIYAVLLAMVGSHAHTLGTALSGAPRQTGGATTFAASRRFNRA
jgi:hypothetical protein